MDECSFEIVGSNIYLDFVQVMCVRNFVQYNAKTISSCCYQRHFFDVAVFCHQMLPVPNRAVFFYYYYYKYRDYSDTVTKNAAGALYKIETKY